jgi:hypothetical protein
LKISIESGWVTRYGAIEPHAIEMNDGSIWMLIRTNKGFLYESYSNDSGTTWSAPRPSSFISSDSPASTVRLADGSIVLLWNSNQRYDDKRSYAAGGREVLHAAISKDDGKSWKGFREIMTTTNSKTPVVRGDRGTAYPSAVELRNGNLLMVSGQGDDASLVMFNPNWLEEKKQEDQLKNLEWWTFHGNNHNEAVWNFPMMAKGSIELNLTANCDLSLALTDHFSVASDTLATASSPIHFTINQSSLGGKEAKMLIKWNLNKKAFHVYLNSKEIDAGSAVFEKTRFGFNYLRISSFLSNPVKINSIRVSH